MANNKPGSRIVKAAGGVAWRPGPGGEPEILLVHRKKYDDWSLPKGKIEPGEPLPMTAVREVLEESGARIALGRRLVSVRYNVSGRPKRVHYWAARVLSVDSGAVPNAEVDEVVWMPAGRAVEKVSYTHDHGVLADFAERPAGTVPLILLRHGKALPKNGWTRDDLVRPLDDTGRSGAKTLADLLACFAPRARRISSPAARCVATLRPLSELTGEQVREVPSLYVRDLPRGTEAADTDTDIPTLIREAIASGEPTIVCAHRENLPDLQAAVLTALAPYPADAGTSDPGTSDPGNDAPDPAPAAQGIAGLPGDWDATLPTSGFWVLNVARLPEAADPAPDPVPADPAPAALPGPAAADRAPSGRWWQRVLGRLGHARPEGAGEARAGSARGGFARSGAARGGSARGGEALAGAAGAAGDGGSVAAGGKVGVLISADRYDLSEP